MRGPEVILGCTRRNFPGFPGNSGGLQTKKLIWNKHRNFGGGGTKQKKTLERRKSLGKSGFFPGKKKISELATAVKEKKFGG